MKGNDSNSYLEDPLEDRTVVFKPGEGEVLQIQGSTVTLKVTSAISNDQLGVYEINLQPDTVGARRHFHRYMDETFIVKEGTLTVQHGDSEVEAEAGSVVHVPRFTPHGFANRSKSGVTVMLIFNPAQQREGFFYGLEQILNATPVNEKDFLALYNRYDSYPC